MGALSIIAVATGASMRMLPWDLARAGGITAYLLLVAAVVLGILESTPRVGRVPPVREVSHHYHRWVMLFSLCFVVVHVASLVLDPYAGVSLAAVFIPGVAQYRPLPVALGTLALLAGLLTGLTAWFPARFPKVWLPIHRFGAVIFGLVWLHGVTSGTDTPRLLLMYAVTGAMPLLAAMARYMITKPQRRRAGAHRTVRTAAGPEGTLPAEDGSLKPVPAQASAAAPRTPPPPGGGSRDARTAAQGAWWAGRTER